MKTDGYKKIEFRNRTLEVEWVEDYTPEVHHYKWEESSPAYSEFEFIKIECNGKDFMPVLDRYNDRYFPEKDIFEEIISVIF